MFVNSLYVLALSLAAPFFLASALPTHHTNLVKRVNNPLGNTPYANDGSYGPIWRMFAKKAPVAFATRAFQTTPQQLARFMHSQEEEDVEARKHALIFDMRTEDDWNAGHILHAINLPMTNGGAPAVVKSEVAAGVAKIAARPNIESKKYIIMHCQSSVGRAPAMAAGWLVQTGLDAAYADQQIFILVGGYNGGLSWSKDQLDKADRGVEHYDPIIYSFALKEDTVVPVDTVNGKNVVKTTPMPESDDHATTSTTTTTSTNSDDTSGTFSRRGLRLAAGSA